ncbi:MAG: MarR family winged helix-turn-helix transcriptional regulator [Rhodoferax sp.]|nr:MarR family winged helix-turn-helix transcriptional regulator [Rhodoferax sp.]
MSAPAPPPIDDTAAQVLRKFRVVFNAIRSHFRDIEKEAGIGGAQVWALSLVQATPGAGVGHIAKSMDIHQSTASNLVKTLLGKQLITLTKSVSDKRSVELHITAEGTTILKKIPGPFEGVLPMALATLPAATLDRLNKDLADLTLALRADEDAGNIPLANL